MQLNKAQVETILNNTPAGVDKRKILDGLIMRGYDLEGVDSNAVRQQLQQKNNVQQLQKEQPQEQPEEKKGFLQKVGGAVSGIGKTLISSERAFGEDIGKSAYLLTGGQKEIDKISQTFLDNGDNFMKLASNTTDKNRKQKLMEYAQDSYQRAGATTEDIIGHIKSNKQILGDAGGVLLDVLSAGTYGKAKTASKALPTIADRAVSIFKNPKTFWQGAKQGAKEGAKLGSIYGSAYGTTEAMKEDKSALDIAKSTFGGAATGAGSGAMLGGLIGGISGKIRGYKTAAQKKLQNFTEDLVMPKSTTKVKEQALREGRVTETGLLSASKITPSKKDLKLAETVKDIVNPKLSAPQNLNLIENTVDEINSGVKAYINVNKRPFNTNQLRTQLNKGRDDLKIVFASDTTAQKTYNALVEEFMKHVGKKDTSGLFAARQTFDNLPAVKKLLDSQALGENVKKEIILTVRKNANEYIASLLPKGNKYRATLLNESQMIEVMMNISEKEAANIGKNKIQLLTEKYPIMKWVVGSTILGTAGVGVGSAFIGSLD